MISFVRGKNIFPLASPLSIQIIRLIALMAGRLASVAGRRVILISRLHIEGIAGLRPAPEIAGFKIPRYALRNWA